MAKSKKNKKKRHHQHHAAVHEYIMRQVHREDMIPEYHVVPESQQTWHRPSSWCWCRPVITDEHPLSGAKIWTHYIRIH